MSSKISVEEELIFRPLLRKGLAPLQAFYFIHNKKMLERFIAIEGVFMPSDTLSDPGNYFVGGSDGEMFNFKNYDPTPINIVSRATSGMMSYHLNPRDKFFSLKRANYRSVEPDNVDMDKSASDRENDIHTIMQLPENFITEAKMLRDKMVSGLGGKVIESQVENMVASHIHYPPRDLGLGSTNGKVFDIFGVYENLTLFEMKMRFGHGNLNPAMKGQASLGMGGPDKSCYRINIRREALFMHLEMLQRGNSREETEESKGYRKYLKKVFGGFSKKNSWIDMWFNDEGILSVRELPYHCIVISQWGPSHRSLGIGKGQGDKAMPLALMVAELTDINLSGYERTFAPPYLLPNAKTLLGSDFGRDGIVYGSGLAGGVPTNLSLNADVRAMIEFGEYYLQKMGKMFFLDVFELVNKSRMTTVEVDRRGSDDFRRVGLFVVQDEATNLNPTTVALNHIIYEKVGADDKAANLLLSASYTSALSYAHKNSIFDQTDRLAESLTRLSALQQQAPAFSDFLDFRNQAENLVKGADQLDFMLTKKEQEENMKKRREREESEADIMRQEAAGKALTNAKLQEEVTNQQNTNQRTPQTG